MASKQYFNFLGTVYDNLPDEDKDRLGEVWKGYEQVVASVYQKFLENDLNKAIFDMITFGAERWLPYTFDETTQINEAAKYQSNQDLSAGIDLTIKYLIKVSIDGGSPIQIDLRGPAPSTTSIEFIRDKVNTAVGFAFAKITFQGAILEFTSSTTGPASSVEWQSPSSIPNDGSEFVLGILTTDLPLKVPEFPWVFSIAYDKVAGIPELRTDIRDETLTDSGTRLLENVDYAVDRTEQLVRFAVQPQTEMWSKRTLIDEESPWNNFGFLMEIYDVNSPEYLRILQGLWFAFWNGPTPENVRRSLYLLFTLPVALEDSTVTSVTATLITTTSDAGVIRAFEIPSGLNAIVVVGESVERFQPLVDGIDVIDKVSLPGFIKTEIGRKNIDRFLTEKATRGPGADTDETKALTLLDEHTFLPQIGVDAFISPDINLSNVQTFLNAIQPLIKTFLFQVIIGEFDEELPLKEKLGLHIDINITPNVDSNQTTFADPLILDDYESMENDALNLDSDGLLFQENLSIEVYSFGGLIDQFDA